VIRREPALIVGLIEALLVLAVAFGLDLTAEQMAAIVAVATVLGGLVVRSQVTPVAELEP
jgi:hypothetical protein